MKRRWCSILAVLVLCLVPMAAAAEGEGVEAGSAVALVKADGKDTYYADIQEAFAAANAAGTASIQLLKDAALPENTRLTVAEGKSLTLDCGNFTLSGSYTTLITVYGTLTFTGGTLKNTYEHAARVPVITVAKGGSFTMSGGSLELVRSDKNAVTIAGVDWQTKASATISGGNVGVEGTGLKVGAFSTVRLSGGTYGAIEADGGSYDPDITVASLLAMGYAFFRDGKPVALEPEQHKLEGPVTVEPCTHIWGEYYRPVEGAETHQEVCPACGESRTPEAHRWSYRTRSIDENPLSQTVICQYCTFCERKNDLGTVTRTADFTVPYGQTKGRVLSVVIEPESLVTRMKDDGVAIEWFLSGRLTDAGAFTTSYTLPENLAVGEYRYAASGNYRFPMNIFIQVTVEPAPLPEDRIHVDEGPFTFSNRALTPAVTVEGLTEGTDYTVAYQDNLGAGTASIVVTGKGNYTGTVTKTFEIRKGALEFDGALTADELTYGTPLSEAEITSTVIPQLDGAKIPGTWKIESEDTPDAGEYPCTAVFVPGDATAAASCEPLTAPVEVTVNRKAFETYESYVQVRAGQTLVVNLTALSLLPEEMLSDGELTAADLRVTSDYDSIFDGTPTVTDGKPAFRIKKNAAEGQWADIGFTVQSKNMDCPYECQVLVVDKLTPMLLLPYPKHTYDGQAPDLSAAISQMTAEYNGEPVPGTFTVKNPETVPVHVRESKSVTVVFTPEDTENYDTAEDGMWTEILPAEITVRVESREVTQNGAMPELEYTVEGLAAGERLKTEPTLTCEARDTAAAGTYAITAAGAAVPDGGDYVREIVYVNGTLTVRASAPPEPDELETKLEVKEGFTEVPPALLALEHLNTTEKLTRVMRTLLTQTGLPEGNTAVYDVALMVSTDGGKTWDPATAGNFPSGGLTVTLPYPAGTDGSYTFTVVHMFTTAAFGKTPGDTESPAVTNTEQGLRFTVKGLSPISVGWRKTTGGGSSSGGGGGSGGVSSYAVTVEKPDHGRVASSRARASGGSTVTLTVTPDSGYGLDTLTVTDSRGNEVKLTAQGGGKYTFAMPGRAVTVKASFAPLPEDTDCPSRAFADLESGAWYHEVVDFVLRNGLMAGYGNGLFRPDNRLTRAQFAQILYNKEGRPAVAGGASFTDVANGAWCAPAIAWAAERGVAGGYGNGAFGPDDAITREQLAVMLWRYAGSPAAPDGGLAFVDAERIGAHAREALRWAVQTGVMNGKGGGVLDPKGLATRAQAAQMLWNFLKNG